MQLRFFLGFCLLVLMVTSLINSIKSLSQSANSGQGWKDPTTLRARVEKEKAKGHRKIVFPAPLIEYPDDISLETAIDQTAIVVADVLDKESRLIDPSTIATFYRLRVIEIVSEPTSAQCCGPKDEEFPIDLPPLRESEIYFVGMGGTMVLDDVEVTIREDFEILQANRRYLLFLSKTPSGKFSVGRIGPRGIFTVAGDGSLDSTLKRFRLGRELEMKARNSLTDLKSQIKQQRNRPK